jgi:hypothetical protein
MFATLYNVAVDLPLQESAWWAAFLWLCRCLYLFSYIRCYCCGVENDCPTHCSSTAPSQFQVVMDGFANGTCTDCAANWNQTFTLSATHATIHPSDATSCCWQVAFANRCLGSGNANFLYLSIANISGSLLTVGAWGSLGSGCGVGSGSNQATFDKSYSFGAVPCATLSSESLTLNANGAPGCDLSAATCEVTTL